MWLRAFGAWCVLAASLSAWAADAPQTPNVDAKSDKKSTDDAPARVKAEQISKFSAKATAAGGTYIHVKNGTNVTLSFAIYVECTGKGTGKFDRHVKLAPGEVAVWRLGADHQVAVTQHQGASCYRVGLVGTDSQGQQHRWGVIGGVGMYGKERMETDVGKTPEDLLSYRHIHLRPIGDF